MRIGHLEFAAPVFLAPMAGVTDTAYRILARELGCPLVYSEMVSDKGINYRNGHTLEMLHTEREEILWLCSFLVRSRRVLQGLPLMWKA